MDMESLKSFIGRQITWLGQSGFKIRSSTGEILYMDPGRYPKKPEPAKVILISRPHSDHYSLKAVARLRQRDTVVAAPRTMANSATKGLLPGETFQAGSFRITGVPAYNLKKPFHPKMRQWLGYIVEVDGIKLYHAGDTDLIPEMMNLRPEVALLPVGGLFTMNVKEAVQAAEVIQPKIVIPMHFGFLIGTGGSGRKFSDAWHGSTIILRPEK